jgi:hypothetical protein
MPSTDVYQGYPKDLTGLHEFVLARMRHSRLSLVDQILEPVLLDVLIG